MSEEFKRFIKAIRKLPEGEKSDYFLRKILGWEYKKIAEFRGVSTGTVSKNIYKAREKLTAQGFGDDIILDD